MSALDQRTRQTVKTACGVRTAPGHWANAPVHAFREWTGSSTLTVWCGLDISLEDGARQTTDLISCSGCGQASWKHFRGVGL